MGREAGVRQEVRTIFEFNIMCKLTGSSHMRFTCTLPLPCPSHFMALCRVTVHSSRSDFLVTSLCVLGSIAYSAALFRSILITCSGNHVSPAFSTTPVAA